MCKSSSVLTIWGKFLVGAKQEENLQMTKASKHLTQCESLIHLLKEGCEGILLICYLCWMMSQVFKHRNIVCGLILESPCRNEQSWKGIISVFTITICMIVKTLKHNIFHIWVRPTNSWKTDPVPLVWPKQMWNFNFMWKSQTMKPSLPMKKCPLSLSLLCLTAIL